MDFAIDKRRSGANTPRQTMLALDGAGSEGVSPSDRGRPRDRQGENTMSTRRALLGGAVSGAAVSWLAAWPGPADATEHWIPGGTRGIQRGQFGFTADSVVGGLGAIPLPLAGALYMIPLTEQVFDESGGARYRMQRGLVTVLQDGLYTLTANVDWAAPGGEPGEPARDVNGRKLLIKRVPVGVEPPPYVPGRVTRIPTNAVSYDTLAGRDMAGSSAPAVVRVEASWPAVTIAARGMASRDVAVPAGSFAPSTGDLALASHTGLADARLGAAGAGMLISARMVAPGVARVTIENRYNAAAVTVPAGMVRIVAESAVATAGDSGSAWSWTNAGRVLLLAGEQLMVAVRSESQGDFLRVGDASFLRIRNVVP
jgi:hypothetical protein